LLCIADYMDGRQDHFLKYHSPRNKTYCGYHDFEYIEILDIKNQIPYHRGIVWDRFFLIRDWILSEKIKEGDIISMIDADICIVNGTQSFEPPEGKSFAYAIDSCNTHCMGAVSIRVSNWSKEMLNYLLSESRYDKFKNNPFWKVFHEQASWYSLAGIDDVFADPKQKSWMDFDHKGWCSTDKNQPVYSIEDLEKNVDILPVEWNVTSWHDTNQFYKIPTTSGKVEDVIFRHFAGSKKWDSTWSLVKMMQ
jgi:hypothetical protein